MGFFMTLAPIYVQPTYLPKRSDRLRNNVVVCNSCHPATHSSTHQHKFSAERAQEAEEHLPLPEPSSWDGEKTSGRMFPPSEMAGVTPMGGPPWLRPEYGPPLAAAASPTAAPSGTRSTLIKMSMTASTSGTLPINCTHGDLLIGRLVGLRHPIATQSRILRKV